MAFDVGAVMVSCGGRSIRGARCVQEFGADRESRAKKVSVARDSLAHSQRRVRSLSFKGNDHRLTVVVSGACIVAAVASAQPSKPSPSRTNVPKRTAIALESLFHCLDQRHHVPVREKLSRPRRKFAGKLERKRLEGCVRVRACFCDGGLS